jgi:hypothetical protein
MNRILSWISSGSWISSDRARRPTTRKVYEPDHSSLLMSLPPNWLPENRGRARQFRVDAIAVPAARSADFLCEAVKIAHLAGRMLIILCSRECRPEDVHALLRASDLRVPVIIVNMAGYVRPDRAKTTNQTRAAGWTSDTAVKRNTALLLARRLGLRHVLFLDDDVRRVDSQQIKRAVSLMEAGKCRAAGWKFLDYPDNSAVSHAYRAVPKSKFGKQNCFIGGGGLLVKIDDGMPHFPVGIYNEDWFFLFPLLIDRQVMLLGALKQLPYDPFKRPKQAWLQEFGDLIAESLYGLAMSYQDDPSIDLQAEIRSLTFWQEELSRRSEFLQYLAAELAALGGNDSRPVALRELAYQPVNKQLRAVKEASDALSEITAKELWAWLRAWGKDAERWRQLLLSISAGLDPTAEPAWTPSEAKDRIQAVSSQLGLDGRVDYVWPVRLPGKAPERELVLEG